MIKDEVMICVSKMDALLERRTNLVKRTSCQHDELEEAETKVSLEVANDTTLTNETKRKAEINSRLNKNAEYQQKKDIYNSTKHELVEVDNEIEKIRFRMKGYEIITRPMW